jgi:diguanylate cyclase (GGDEF)-like protein
MKFRLAMLNIALPIGTLLALYFVPKTDFLLPGYLVMALILVILGRAYLLLQQQTLFAYLPILILSLPNEWTHGFNLSAPFVMHSFLLYLWVVNMQWGQRPWLHPLHWLNLVLLVLFVVLAKGWIELPKAVTEYAYSHFIWMCVFAAAVPLLLINQWRRIGRWASYWPLLIVVTYELDWTSENYLVLWVTFAALLSLTIDSYVMAFVDELTGILGRRALEFKLKTMGKHYLLAMADVDHFKKFNDTHGHQVGDDVLKMVARILSGTTNATAYRYGGEEFAVVFRKGPTEDAEHFLNQTRERLAAYELYPKSKEREKNNRGKGSQRKPLHITASFGLARQQIGEKFEQVIERADKALYQAKAKGRNRVIIAK